MQNDTQNQSGRVTVTGAICEKIAGYIKNHKVNHILKRTLELFSGVFAGVAVVSPGEVASAMSDLLKTKDFAIVKFCVVVSLFFGRKLIARAVRKVFEFMRARKRSEKLIDGIPVAELVDYLVRNHHFKREGVNGVRETFGLNMERFNRLAAKLEDTGVLERGENNSRVLGARWSRQTLVDFLSGVKRSDDLRPHFSIHRIGENQKVRFMNPEIAVK